MNAGAAEFYLRKVIRLKPPDQQSTVGYAHFCLGTLKGLLALGFLKDNSGANPGNPPAEAVMELEEAEKCHHMPAHQYHLKGYLLFGSKKFEEAAGAWARAGELYWPPSGKMYLNCGCAWTMARNYEKAVIALERAVSVSAKYPSSDVPDMRKEIRESPECEELQPFRSGEIEPKTLQERFDRLVAAEN